MLRRGGAGGRLARLPPPGPLRLTLPDGSLLYTNEGETGAGPYPTPETLLELVAAVDDPSCTILRECARQVFTSGPMDKLAEWGSAMLTTAPRQGPDVSRLETLHLTNKRGVCGYSFKKGDICWNCRTCQLDPTCVQCDACFKASDHEGHEVLFHSSNPGGCCDCGDLEAWKQAGCCKAHSGGADLTSDPVENLPASMRLPATVVFEEACRLFKGVFLHSVQCFNISSEHRFYQVAGSNKGSVFIRLHNDDIHTFQEVTETLVRVDLSETHAHEHTKRVDEEGHAHVKSGPPAELRGAYDRVLDSGLLVSLVDEEQIFREYRAEKLLAWLSELCHKVDGLARIVSQILTSPHAITTPQHPSYEEGTRWSTPVLRLHQPEPDGSLVVSSAAASLPLSVLMMTDFFLLKKIRQEFHDLLLNLLVDSTFKPALAKELTTVYPVLNGLYTRGIGTAEDSIFSFSVQLYTTPSLVRWLAFRTKGEEELGTKGLLTILTDSLLQSFRVAGWVEGEPLSQEFWDHHFIIHRRFHHVLKDLDYTLQTAGTAWAMREGVYPGPGPKPLVNWITLLTSLQLADLIARKTGNHQEYESTVWMHAFSLALPLTSTCSVIITQGLQPDDDMKLPSPETLTQAVTSLTSTVAQAMLRWVNTLAPAQFNYDAAAAAADPPAIVRFHVHRDLVSYHLPLHRFLVAVVLEGLSRGASFPTNLDVNDMDKFGTILAEFPIRCLVLSAQVAAGLWRRNGLPIHRQAVHYSGVPFCSVFRDLDLGALQLSCLYLGFDPVLTLLLDRYTLTHWATTPQKQQANRTSAAELFDAKTYSILAEEMLLFLIHMVTELPRPPGREYKDAALRREMVHGLCCAECSHSELQRVSNMVDDNSIGAEGFDNVLKAVSIQRAGPEGTRLFDLKPEAVMEYDATFFHLGKHEHETAQERIVQKRRSLPREARARHCVSAPPAAHPAMAPVRNILYWPQVLTLQHTVLSRAVYKREESSPVLLSRVLHILTLQLHCLDQCLHVEEQTRHYEPPSLRAYQLRGGDNNSNPVADFMSAITRPMTTITTEGEGPISILELVASLARLPSESTHIGCLYEEGLRWIMDEVASVHIDRVPPSLRRVLDGFHGSGANATQNGNGEQGGGGGGGGGSDGEEMEEDTRRERARAAKARCMAKIDQSAQEFIAGTDLKDTDDTELAPDSLECGASACLYCHERTGAPLGYIGFVQKSTALATAMEKADSHKGIATRYRVSHKECRIRADHALDSPEVGLLRKGDQVVVEEKRGRRLRISWPLEGWVSEFTADRARILEPMSRYCWQTWGRVRLYTTLCGHAVHHDCWDAFYASVLQQMSNEDRYDGQYALDISRREFTCPLCKTLSNVLVPHLPDYYSPPATPISTIAPPPVPHLTTWLLSDVTSGPSPVGSPSLLASIMCPEAIGMPRAAALPDQLAVAVRRFTDSLLEVCDVSYSRLVIGTEMERHGRRQLLRTIYTAWTSLAYAVQLDVVTDGVSNGERVSHLRILARATRELQSLMLNNSTIMANYHDTDDDPSLNDLIYRPLAALLRGECRAEVPDTTPSGSVRTSALKRFPLGLVLDHEVHGPAGQNLGLPLQCMNMLHRDRVEAGELPPLEAWPMMDKPLLSWDLATLAAAVLTTIRHGADLVRGARVLALARLAQAMLEPCPSATTTTTTTTDSSRGADGDGRTPMEVVNDDEEAEAAAAAAAASSSTTSGPSNGLQVLRAALCRGLHREVPTWTCHMEQTLRSRWRPYLCTLITLLDILGAMRTDSGSSSSSSDYLYSEVEDLCQLLGLPTEFGREEAGALSLVFERWGTQYRLAQKAAAWRDVPDAKGGAAAADDAEWVVLDDNKEKSTPPGEDVMGAFTAAPPTTTTGATAATTTTTTTSSSSAASRAAGGGGGRKELGPLVYHCAPYLASVDGGDVLPDLDGNRMPMDLPLLTQGGLSTTLYDMSHMGVSDDVSVGLMDLPRHYTELYAMLKEKYWSMAASRSRAGSRGSSSGGQGAMEDPAVCLMCGSAMGAGPRASNMRAGTQNIGECTAHARYCGAGHGIFLLVNKGSIVLMRDSRAAFYPSVYVDQYGEEDPHLRRGRPLFLSTQRYDRLLQLYRQHGAAREVARVRATAERVIRENYY